MYRGRVIRLMGIEGVELYVDGDTVAAPSDELPVMIEEKRLKIFR